MSKQKKTEQTKPSNQTDQDSFPGYPQYPPQEDIVRNGERVEGNLGDEGFDSQKSAIPSEPESNNDQPASIPESEITSEFEVTEEDLEALGPVDLSLDLGEDEQLKQ